jgi:hypothetical protein
MTEHMPLGGANETVKRGQVKLTKSELRIQHEGRPYRILYAFDPTRTAFLLLGGDKTGDERWYDKMVPKADAIYADHLKSL